MAAVRYEAASDKLSAITDEIAEVCDRMAELEASTLDLSFTAHTHATGHPSRLNRNMGKDDYAVEECCAELGAAFVTSRLGMSYSDAQSPAYLDH
ncbi:zincin-like metallopeptidase domain-containing protein [Tardiphaga sp.]|uniref:zincin-like metallopeptidase domain-containing protein n=1 Tax=Tardiphaga sp. TaxID=1926292 RepID=UPI0026126B96|nr:zincin-like metallopeptidase domain-containing protein [Tardiphaga sp.]